MEAAHSFSGTVVRGFGRGRGIGFPTVNLQVPAMPVAPGVYAVTSAGKKAVLMYGKAKTFDAAHESVEVHFLEDVPEPVPEELVVTVLLPLREIRKFDSVDELQAAIQEDIRQANVYFDAEASA